MTTLDEISCNDESWDIARQLVHRHFSTASITWRLIRNAWLGSIDQKEFIKLFTFTRLSPSCLIRAANMPLTNSITQEQLSQAVQTLGVPLASVVVGINLATSTALNENPSPLWRKTCLEIMTLSEIGYHFGSKIRELGPAVGCLAGFGVGCGMLVALNEDFKHLREWMTPSQTRPSSVEAYGTEICQLSGFLLQHLGYGHEAAFGAAFGSGAYSKAPLEFSPQAKVWIAACRWIESLRYSRNYPRDLGLRSMFPAITPPAVGSTVRNSNLEALYAELAPIVREGSNWTWHLPKNSYDETQDFLDREAKKEK